MKKLLLIALLIVGCDEASLNTSSLKQYLENKSVLGDDGYDLMDTRAYLTASS